MDLVLIGVTAVLLLTSAFGVLNFLTRKRHFSFTKDDVVGAIQNVLSTTDKSYDRWDLFLAWPIRDGELESIRQQCLMIAKDYTYKEPGKDIASAGEQKLRVILEELKRGK
jgi:hypothetical protein